MICRCLMTALIFAAPAFAEALTGAAPAPSNPDTGSVDKLEPIEPAIKDNNVPAGQQEAPAVKPQSAEGVDNKSLSQESARRPGGEKPESAGAKTFKVTPEMIRQVENVDLLMLVARHQPQLKRDPAGKVIGLTALEIPAIPLASTFGFKDGDIVTAINGIKLVSEAQLFALASQLQDARRFEVQFLRNDQPQRCVIEVPQE